MSNFRKSGSFTLSPKKTHGFNVPGAFVTPVSRRQSFNTPTSLGLLDGSANNDEAEKRERQLNRLQQLQSKGVPSPTGTPSDRRKSLNTFAGLTNQQITEHYSKCIQLSAENKINIKNAFNLQLIDYMTELLKRKDSEMNNFQVASCTLDASTKIYGYRVDSVHTDTLKMAGGLGRTKEKSDMDGDYEGGGENDEKGKKRLKARKCVTIEKNLKNLDVAHFDLEFDVDPLFKKTASQFDDGRSGGGQFLSTLQMLDDTCQLMLDSETVLQGHAMECQSAPCSDTVTIPPIPDIGKLISPTFASFEFTTWKLGDDDETTFGNLSKTREDHMFDMNATPEPLEADHMDDDNDGFQDMVGDYDAAMDETVITLGGGACNQGPRPPPPQLEIVHLKDHLANTPLEYSYFDTRVMSAWAGPGHWKLKSLSSRGSSADGNKDAHKGKDKQKKDLTLEYDKDIDFESFFTVLRRATKLSQTTVKKWSFHNNALPVDQHYDPAKLSKLYLRPGIVIRRQVPEKPPAEVDDEINDYNYDNPNDKENYCPDVDASGNYEDQSGPGYDDTDIFSQTVLPSQPSQDPNDDKTKDFLGDNLVEAPNKVSLIHIGYARTAKKMDMKKLKNSVWSLLTDAESNKENKGTNAPFEAMNKESKKEFSKLYSDLYPRLPPKMAENLSVPLAFIALLHIANERCLMLTSVEELGDFVISQD